MQPATRVQLSSGNLAALDRGTAASEGPSKAAADRKPGRARPAAKRRLKLKLTGKQKLRFSPPLLGLRAVSSPTETKDCEEWPSAEVLKGLLQGFTSRTAKNCQVQKCSNLARGFTPTLGPFATSPAEASPPPPPPPPSLDAHWPPGEESVSKPSSPRATAHPQSMPRHSSRL